MRSKHNVTYTTYRDKFIPDIFDLDTKGILDKLATLEGSNVRIHSVDIRSSISGTYEYLIELFALFNDELWKKLSDIEIIGIYKFLITLDISETNYHTVIDSLIKLNPHTSRDALERNLNKYVTQIKKRITKSTLPASTVENLLNAILISSLDSIEPTKLHSSIICTPMDLYLLLRLFTKFDHPERLTQDCNDTMENIIIACGAKHIEIYVKVFKELFNIEPQVSIKHPQKIDEYQCNNLPDNFSDTIFKNP